jgi:hypothetical protein
MGFRGGQYYVDPTILSGAQVTPTLKSADANLTAFDSAGVKEIVATLNVHEHVVTGLTGTHNDLVFIARTPGTTPTVRVTYVDPAGNNASLSVSVSSQDITVNLATGSGGAITSTAAQIKTAIEASAAASALVVVEYASGNDGTGVVTAMSQQTLAAPTGTNPTLDIKLQSSVDDGSNYYDVTSFAQATGAGVQGKLFSPIAGKSRWVVDVGGTTPVFAVSIVAQAYLR